MADPGGPCPTGVPYTEEEFQRLRQTLSEHLPFEFISERAGPGGKSVPYLASWKAISLANEHFAYNGWSSHIVSITQDYCDQLPSGRYSAGCSAIMRVILKDGAFHEDVGYGQSENQKSKGTALELAKKAAVSDGLKRAIRYFGQALGLSVYDKPYLKSVKEKPVKCTAFRKPNSASGPKPTISNCSGPSAVGLSIKSEGLLKKEVSVKMECRTSFPMDNGLPASSAPSCKTQDASSLPLLSDSNHQSLKTPTDHCNSAPPGIINATNSHNSVHAPNFFATIPLPETSPSAPTSPHTLLQRVPPNPQAGSAVLPQAGLNAGGNNSLLSHVAPTSTLLPCQPLGGHAIANARTASIFHPKEELKDDQCEQPSLKRART